MQRPEIKSEQILHLYNSRIIFEENKISHNSFHRLIWRLDCFKTWVLIGQAIISLAKLVFFSSDLVKLFLAKVIYSSYLQIYDLTELFSEKNVGLESS